MAEKNALCTIAGQNGFTESHSTYSTDGTYAGYGNEKYWIYILKLRTPAFRGKSRKIRFDLMIHGVSVEKSDLRYALCSSDENWASYRYTDKEVADPAQLTAGVLNMTGLTSSGKIYAIEIDTAELRPDTDYYLYLWDHDTTAGLVRMSNAANHTVTVSYRQTGGARIFVDGAPKLFPAIIWTGTKWKRFIPIVYTADGWKRQS